MPSPRRSYPKLLALAGMTAVLIAGLRLVSLGQASLAADLEEAPPLSVGPAPTAKPAPPPAGALDVIDFGADPSAGGDDTAALQRAFDAADRQDRDVYLPPGHYGVTRALTFRASGRTLCGSGARSVLAGDTDRTPLLQLDHTLRATVRDLRFEGSHVNQQNRNDQPAIDLLSCAETRVLRVHTYGTGYLARDTGAMKTTLEDCVCEDYGRIGYLVGTGGTVRRCRFICRDDWKFEGQMNGIYASAGKRDILVEENEFIHCGMYAMTLWGSQSGVWTENVTIRRNRFDRCQKGFVVAAGPNGPRYRNVRFTGNVMRNSGEKSIHVGKFNGSTADGTALLIENNVFEDPGADMSIFLTNWAGRAPITGVRISGNRFLAPERSAYNGLFVWQAKPEAELSDVLIEKNMFKDFGHHTRQEKAHAAIYLKAGSRVTVRGNTFQPYSGAGAACDVAAVKVDPAMRTAVIEDNRFLGNGQGRYFAIQVTGNGAAGSAFRNNTLRKSRVAPADIATSANRTEP